MEIGEPNLSQLTKEKERQRIIRVAWKRMEDGLQLGLRLMAVREQETIKERTI